MSDDQVYAMKGDPDWEEQVYASLQHGVGRFGWSYMKDADGGQLGDANLQRIKSRIDDCNFGWSSLTKDEQDRYQSFLFDLKRGDWVVYINVPKWGKCTLAQVTGPYYWDHIDDDYNHCFSVDPQTVRDFERNSDIVHPSLGARLKLRGRFWRIYAEEEFKALVTALNSRVVPQPRTSQTNIRFLRSELEPVLLEITRLIHHTHPNYDLEGLLELIFQKVPGVREVKRQGGAGDHGADLIVEFEDGLPYPLQTQYSCVVQVKSFEGDHWEKKAVDDIRRAFANYPSADMGLIISTANASTSVFDDAIENLRQSSGKRVELLIGSDVSKFILRYGAAVLG